MHERPKMEKEHRDGKPEPEPEASERASWRLAMRRDVRAYREHLHVVARDPARAVRAGTGDVDAEQNKLSKGDNNDDDDQQDDLEAVLAVSPVRLVLDQDQEEATDLSKEPREDAGHVGVEAEVHESDVLAALHREWLPPPPPLSGPQNKEPSQTANATTSLDEQRIEYDLMQQPRTESPFRPTKRVPSQIENINLPRRDTTKQTMMIQHDRAAEQTPRLTPTPASKTQERQRPAQVLEPKPKLAVVPLHEYAAAHQDQERPAGLRTDANFPKGKNAKPVFSPIPETRAKPLPLPDRPKLPLKSRWRKAAKAHRERLQRRDKDFVSWTAQSMKTTRHGSESFTALPNAPVPRGPRRVKSLQTISREYEDKNLHQRPHMDNAEEENALEKERQELVARAKSKLARRQAKAEALSTATQTPVLTPTPLRRWVVLEHVPVNELDCLRVLRGDRSGLDSNGLVSADEPTREELEDPMLKRFHEERRRLGASFEAIRGILVHRENALFRELVEGRDELECAKAELRKQILAALANDQDPDTSENRNRRKFKRNPLQEVSPFVCGTTPATASTNQQVRTSMAAAARRKQKASVKQEHQDAENAWEGSPFKIKLLQEVIDKLQKRIAFRVLCWTARRRVMLRRLCAEREELVKRLELRRAFIGLATLHRARAWLRERARKRRAHRARASLRTCWRAWKGFSVEAALALGKAVTAEAYKRRKTLWRAFAVWRAQPLAIERYETVANLCARRFFFEVSARRALFGWRQVTVRDKLVRLRLVCRASESRLGAEARVPERWTRAGMREALSLAYVASRARLHDSLQQSTIGLAQGAVSSICVAVRWQAHIRQSIDRRQAARDAYILCARAARKAYPSARARRVSLASQLPAQLTNLGLGRLAARPLGQHIAALRSFVAGDSLRYGLPTENDRRRPRSPEAKTPEHSRFDPALAWLSARTPYPDPKWQRDLPLALASVRLLRKSLRDWHETAHAIACIRRGDLANALLLVKRVWRGLRTNVMLGRLRTHLIAWRQTLNRGTCEGKRARTKRAFSQWRAIASRRCLLRRVFSLTDPPADQLTEQFWLLSKVLAGWQNFVQTQRSTRHGIAADLHYEQNLLAKAFSGWRALHNDSLGRRFLCAGSVVDAATARAILWHM